MKKSRFMMSFVKEVMHGLWLEGIDCNPKSCAIQHANYYEAYCDVQYYPNEKEILTL